MSGYRGHIAGALIVWVVGLIAFLCLRYVTGVQALGWAAAAVLGGLFPDLDIKSIGQKWFFRTLFVIGMMLFVHECYRFISIMMLVATVPLLVRHRGLLHSLFFITGLTVVCCWLLAFRFPCQQDCIVPNGIFFWLGAVSHLMLDGHGVFAGYKRPFYFLTKKIRRFAKMFMCLMICY